MTISDFMKYERMTEAQFGHLVGLSQSQVNRLRRGLAFPSGKTARRIQDRTGGKVTLADFQLPQAPAA
jgi:transcriptional regulator with XRE-family HTH domain